MKVEYIIRQVMEETPESWGIVPSEYKDGGEAAMLSAINTEVKDNPEYVIEGLDKFTIEVKKVKD